jgi:3',5'-cyclic AMP phosphodiesterase CpdA
MRAAHITDIHVECIPRFDQLFSKRAIGAVNLYVLGRRHHFTRKSAEALVEAVVAAAPDVVLCTGDLTATALPEEFAAAAELLRPVTDRFPFVVIPGNHDVYTGESVGRFAETFGAWCDGGKFPFSRTFSGIEVIGADVCRPHVLSRGYLPAEQLERLDAMLAAGTAPAVVLLHYPLRDRHGAPYGPATRNIENASAIEAVITRHPRVVAVLHGHEHHGYRTLLPRPAGEGVVSLNPGASGYAFLPERRRTAHWCLYDFDADGRIAVDRFAFDGERFVPEAGGAYASGR